MGRGEHSLPLMQWANQVVESGGVGAGGGGSRRSRETRDLTVDRGFPDPHSAVAASKYVEEHLLQLAALHRGRRLDGARSLRCVVAH